MKRVSGPKVSAIGRLVGGNLSIINSLMGTPWEIDFRNHILFLEEVSEAPYRVHRLLLQLKLANKFRRLRGIVLGDFIEARNDISPKDPTYQDVFKDIFRDATFPVVSGLPVGHADLNFPIPIGTRARINQNRLEILEPAVIS